MPNCRLETSRRLASAVRPQSLFTELHAMLVERAGAKIGDCKSRIVVPDAVVIGEGEEHLDMVHLEIGLLPGRSVEIKTDVGQRALELLRAHFAKAADGLSVQATVQIREIDRETYFKASV